MVAQELVRVDGFKQEWVYVLYFVMEEPKPLNIHVELKVRIKVW